MVKPSLNAVRFLSVVQMNIFSSIRRKRTENDLNDIEEDPVEWEKIRKFLRLKKKKASNHVTIIFDQ